MKYTTDFRDIKQFKPFSFRGMIRDFALTGLSVKAKLPRYKESFFKPRIQFLYIHHVFDDEISKFDNLLNELSKCHTFIPYSEAIRKITSNEIDKSYISISSDDGFKNNLKAAQVLEKYNAKACFFINPDSIGLTDFNKIKEFCSRNLNFPPTEFMNWSDVDKLLKLGHEIGSHTMGHINIATTDLNKVKDNISESFDVIQSRCGKVEHFAFPYGRFFHFNLPSYNYVFEAGFKSCATAERGCHISNEKINLDELLIRRDHVVCDWNLDHTM